jgi:hypothetical protein
VRRTILVVGAVLVLALWGLCCAERVRLSQDSWPNHENPHLDLHADRTIFMRPGVVQFTALFRGQPIAAEWACPIEQWTFGDGQSALRAEGESSIPCAGQERHFEHAHQYGAGTYEAQLTLRGRKKHNMASNVVTIFVKGND